MKAVKIKPMLTRLQNTIGRDDLIEQMVLVKEPNIAVENKFINTAKFIVGYNSSCHSHTALDIALCMAHQARLASNMQITVQAVFVVEDNQNLYIQGQRDTHNFSSSTNQHVYEYLACDLTDRSKSSTSVLMETRFKSESLTVLEEADAILCQAQRLAQEWQSNFSCLLRFGSLAQELRQVIDSAGADVLFLGCNSADHPIIQSLGTDLRCAILGIPSSID
ncbi:hypothetical protein NIES4071_12480 [Calothrix sp. NIES-4071]|nr:hypothetical protein NIES4071_12480 [Calothrix sp. NIES-4071]BAZ55588.1 hypothetical protein NIES4105_12440 [Calothrix sp. NIES-4105]